MSANALAKVPADRFLNWLKGTAYPATVANVYAALLTTNPTKNDGTGLVECSDSGYARQVIASAAWSGITQSADNLHDQISNSNALTFPAASAGYTVVGVALYDALTTGNLLMWQAVTSQAVASGNQYQIGAGSLVVEA